MKRGRARRKTHKRLGARFPVLQRLLSLDSKYRFAKDKLLRHKFLLLFRLWLTVCLLIKEAAENHSLRKHSSIDPDLSGTRRQNMINRRQTLQACTTALGLLGAFAASAQSNFPSMPITIVVPYGAGGGTDFFVRAIAPKMSEKLGQPVIVENKPGGGTSIAAMDVARAAPDGHRLLVGDQSTFSTNPILYKKLAYDPQRDFTPITMTGRTPYVLVVNPTVHPQKNVKELLAKLRAAPAESVNYGSAGLGGPAHLTGLMMERAANIQLVHVPYRGTGPAMPDLLSGQIGMLFTVYSSVKSHVSTGKLRAIGIAAQKEQAELPDIAPIAKELPGFESWFWHALAAPKGTPKAVIDRVRDAYAAAIKDPAIRQQLLDSGIEPLLTSSTEMDTYVRAEADRMASVIRSAKITLD